MDPSRGFVLSLGTVMSLHLLLAALGLARQDPAVLVTAGAVFAVVAAAEMVLSWRATGEWVSDAVREVVLGTGTAASTAYVLGLGAATWAAAVHAWEWAVAASFTAGAAYAVVGHVWLRRRAKAA